MIGRVCDRPGCTSSESEVGATDGRWFIIARRVPFVQGNPATYDACSESCAVYLVEMLGEADSGR